MRVIAGLAGGIRLEVPQGGIRPTMDRVKAAIFSSLGERVIGARVLDLFAGAGGLGIEALSRGAASALFVENNRSAVAAIERNLAKTRLSGQVRAQDVFDFLRRPNLTERYEIIFADPPYDPTERGESFTDLLLASNALAAGLTDDGVLVLEKRPAEDLPKSDLWEVVRQKKYGATETVFLKRKSGGPSY